MSLGTKLIQAVQKEAAMKRPLPLQAIASDELRGRGRVRAAVTLTDNDRFSHMASELKVAIDRSPTKQSNRAARNTGENAIDFVRRATYLTESLQCVEANSGGDTVVRSTPATMRGVRAPYFEAVVGKDELSLRRYQPHTDRPGREDVPFCLTDEVMTRLVEDAAAVLAGKV